MNYDDPRDYKAKKVSKFLEKMAQIESSGGKNTNHKEIKSGIHKGTSAVGNYGIMPNTAIEMGKRYKIKELEGLEPVEAQVLLTNDPELAERIAESMASGLLEKTDEETANYMWQYGHNKIPEDEKVKASPRTKKFKILKKNE